MSIPLQEGRPTARSGSPSVERPTRSSRAGRPLASPWRSRSLGGRPVGLPPHNVELVPQGVWNTAKHLTLTTPLAGAQPRVRVQAERARCASSDVPACLPSYVLPEDQVGSVAGPAMSEAAVEVTDTPPRRGLVLRPAVKRSPRRSFDLCTS
jgi:hypothetical protein